MAWVIHKENVLQLLRDRLDQQLYCNSQHPFLESRYVIPLMEVFPHGGEYLAEYEEQGNIICAFVMSKYSALTAAAYVDGVCQISLTYIDRSLSQDKFASIINALFNSLPKFFLAINFELQDPDLTDEEKFSNMKNAVVNQCANNTSIPPGMEFEEYWQQRSKSVRKDLARRMRSLERENIQVEYRVIDDEAEIDQGFDEYCRLEGAGWKGEQGTALTATNEQGMFYKRVMDGFALNKQAKFHQLLFDGVVVASLMTIENSEMIIVVKTTYDEDMSKFSPGRLLDYYMLKNLLTSSNQQHIENYTNASANDQKWFPRVREMYDVTVYRSPLVKQLAQFKQKLN